MVLQRLNASALMGPLALLAVLVVADALLGEGNRITTSFSAAALLAAVRTTPQRTTAVALLATFMAFLAGTWDGNFGERAWAVRLLLCALICAFAVHVARDRERRDLRLQRMTVVAEAAQRAVLRTLPTAIGPVGLAARYLSAADDALIGGDLYEVIATPHGVRVIVGDVRGKGLDAVQLAAAVIGAFRQASFTVAELPALVSALDRVVQSVSGDEDFVTAVIAEFHDDGSMLLVDCGHHPPLLVGPSGHELLETGDEGLPLGLGGEERAVQRRATWQVGARVLFYTDGLVEARDAGGAFFDLESNVGLLQWGSLEDALDALVSRLHAHTPGGLHDDLALVLVERRHSAVPGASEFPAGTIAGRLGAISLR